MNEIQNTSKLLLNQKNNLDDYKKCEEYENSIISNEKVDNLLLMNANEYALNKVKEIILFNPELGILNGVYERPNVLLTKENVLNALLVAKKLIIDKDKKDTLNDGYNLVNDMLKDRENNKF